VVCVAGALVFCGSVGVGGSLQAAECPSFAGRYEGVQGGQKVRLEVIQTECSRIEATYRYEHGEELKRAVVLDGRRHQEMDSPEILIFSTYTWAGREVDVLQETRWRTEGRRLYARGRITQSEVGEWVERTRYEDDAGNNLGETTQIYKPTASTVFSRSKRN
jgi:hypothetical protein